jgi:iron complex transport system permease protein
MTRISARTAESERTPASAVALPRNVRGPVVLAILGASVVAVFLLSLAIGSVWIPLEEIFSILSGQGPAGPSSIVVMDVRLPRALTALLAGAALGVAGLQMQTLFRNPLADPFVLGLSSGASLGVALVVLGSSAATGSVFAANLGLAGDAAVTGAAVVGAMLALTIVLAVSRQMADPATVLITGLMLGYAVSAFVTVLLAGANPQQLQRWIGWGFGSFSGVTWERFLLFASSILLGLLAAAATTKQLNALLLGENYARTMGLNAKRMRWITIAAASILGGVVTAFCGPITFLGIAVPHLCRVAAGTSDHRILIPAVILMGGLLALVAQIVSLLPGSAGILPLNAVTALIGAPVVLTLLLRHRRGVFIS